MLERASKSPSKFLPARRGLACTLRRWLLPDRDVRPSRLSLLCMPPTAGWYDALLRAPPVRSLLFPSRHVDRLISPIHRMQVCIAALAAAPFAVGRRRARWSRCFRMFRSLIAGVVAVVACCRLALPRRRPQARPLSRSRSRHVRGAHAWRDGPRDQRSDRRDGRSGERRAGRVSGRGADSRPLSRGDGARRIRDGRAAQCRRAAAGGGGRRRR